MNNRLSKIRAVHTVSNKKTHLADFETCAFCVNLRNHLSYKTATVLPLIIPAL